MITEAFLMNCRRYLGKPGEQLAFASIQKLNTLRHGNFEQWQEIVDSLPLINPSEIDLNSPVVRVGTAGDCTDSQRSRLKQLLGQLHPWRKGPFEFFGVEIDTEWRSDMKWDRLKDAIEPLADKRVLDIGSGNGYHCFRAAGENAKIVVGIDPFLLYYMQALAFAKCARLLNAGVLFLGVEDMPQAPGCFDAVFSMGLLYHRRRPLEHINQLLGCLCSGGELIIETLIVDGDNTDILQPQKRYAKMRNLWQIPSPAVLLEWLKDAGFKNPEIIDITKTTTKEQRSTDWMKFESLEDFLDPKDHNKTIEGYPAPKRAIAIAKK